MYIAHNSMDDWDSRREAADYFLTTNLKKPAKTVWYCESEYAEPDVHCLEWFTGLVNDNKFQLAVLRQFPLPDVDCPVCKGYLVFVSLVDDERRVCHSCGRMDENGETKCVYCKFLFRGRNIGGHTAVNTPEVFLNPLFLSLAVRASHSTQG